MTTLSFFAEYTETTLNLIDKVINDFPCFVKWESIEMNWMEITVKARAEDMASIEKIFSEIA